MTPRGALGSATAQDHETTPQPGTVYSYGGRNTGLPANLNNAMHYPVEACCQECGQMIRCEVWLAAVEAGQWVHTGRMPGDPLP